MKRFVKTAAAAILCCAVGISAVSCGKKNADDVSKYREFSKIRAVPTVEKLETTGYVAQMLYGNIENWTVNALENNPGIIDQIAEGPYADYVTDILTDKDKYVENNKMKVAVEKNHGADGGRSLMITSFNIETDNELQYDFSGLEHAVTDFAGFKGIIFYADASGFGKDETYVGIGIRETDTDSDGVSSGIREKWCLSEDEKVYLKSADGSSWEETATVKSTLKSAGTGRMILPAGFRGWVCVPVPESFVMTESMGRSDNILTARKVDSLLLAVESRMGNKGKSIYFSDFSIAGDVGGEQPKTDISQILSSATVKEFFPLGDLALGEGKNTGGWDMTVWFNEYAGKLLTGVSLQYAANPCKELLAEGNAITEGLAKAQKEDGYLGVYRDEMRFGLGGNWDVWGHYHLIYGLISWYRTTGNKTALDVAVKASDCVYDFFMGSGRTIDSVGNQTMNLAVCHSFAELYKETGVKKYLDAAVKIIEEEFPLSGDWMNGALEGKDFYESSLPRWEAIHPILALATVYEITGEEKYFTAFENIWWSIAKTDRHNSGGFSTTEQAQGDPYAEGSVETCCTVAWQAFSSLYLQFCRNSVVADELELTYLNGMIGSLLENEYYTTYDTPTEGKTRVSAQSNVYSDPKFLFHSGAVDFTCCQANISRGIGEIVSWALLTDAEGIYLNWYGEGSVTGKTPSKGSIVLTQETSYPLNGAVKITVSGLAKQEKFRFSLRIPSWCDTASVKINGAEQSGVTPGKYYTVDGTWNNGDVIELSLDVGIHFWVSEKDSSLASVYYGPVLFGCFSSDGIRFASNENFTADDFRNANVSYANDGLHWMQFTVNGKGGEYTFYDFASIGKFKAYRTWIKVGGLPEAVIPEKNGTPIWCAGCF